jgi:predicted DCC family thiol-disulfide oxidoreductase YuxK
MTEPRLVVWYNTRCPVCDAGINRQRHKLIDAVKAGTVEFRDINLQPDALAPYGASLADVRRRLHAIAASAPMRSRPASSVAGGARSALRALRAEPSSLRRISSLRRRATSSYCLNMTIQTAWRRRTSREQARPSLRS